MNPIDAETTAVRISTLAPNDRLASEEERLHWERNHEITCTTLTEDFDIGESVQAGLKSGANEHLTFGRFEGALAAFNTQIDKALS